MGTPVTVLSSITTYESVHEIWMFIPLVSSQDSDEPGSTS